MTKKEKQMAGINKNNAKVKAEKEKAVKDALEKLSKKGPFTFKQLREEAGVSKTYFQNHPDLKKLVDSYINSNQCKNRNSDSQEAHIQLLQKELSRVNKELDKLLKENDKDLKYKEKYEDALKEIKKLKEQLDASYSSNLPDFL